MRIQKLPSFAIWAFAFLLSPSAASFGQTPNEKNGEKPQKIKEAPDEFRAILKEIEEAYKAPFEVDKDIRDELRKFYRQPTPEREGKIFREIRRLYATTTEQEQIISREIRRGSEQLTPELEDRIFQEIRRAEKLPLGTVPFSVQVEQTTKLFHRLDRDNNGLLVAAEMPDFLRDRHGEWDRNRDGAINLEEYGAYYQAQLKTVSNAVLTGDVQIKLPRGLTVQDLTANAPQPIIEQRRPVEPQRPAPMVAPAARPASKLPDWFTQYDTDQDGQVGLYEWRKAGKSVDEFAKMDRDGDFLLTAQELTLYLMEQSKTTVRDSGEKKR